MGASSDVLVLDLISHNQLSMSLQALHPGARRRGQLEGGKKLTERDIVSGHLDVEYQPKYLNQLHHWSIGLMS